MNTKEKGYLYINISSVLYLMERLNKAPCSVYADDQGDVCIPLGDPQIYCSGSDNDYVGSIDSKGDTHIGTLLVVQDFFGKHNLQLGEDEWDNYQIYIRIESKEYLRVDPYIVPIGIPFRIKKCHVSSTYHIYDLHMNLNTIPLQRSVPLPSLDVGVSSVMTMATSGIWDISLVQKYTKGYKYVAFSSSLDPIESLILQMICQFHSINSYTSSVISKRGDKYKYKGERCVFIGSREDPLCEYSRYNDVRWKDYQYFIARIIDLSPQ